jgi:lipopolysaccharide/colanic/teichoic acid biosynthesis glycosyltransferase
MAGGQSGTGTARLSDARIGHTSPRAVGDPRPYDAIKRALDVLVSGVGLVAALPFAMGVIAAIYLSDGPPAFYTQERVGRGGRVFRVFKFRSMVRNAEAMTGAVLADRNDPRITRVGRLLRKTAMDELPQLLNIFLGHMSFVGPRPERPELVAQIAKDLPEFRRREQIRPGLTGLAQVYGRYYTEPARKLPYDVAYIARRSLWLDLHLFLHSWRITSKAKWDSDEAVR